MKILNEIPTNIHSGQLVSLDIEMFNQNKNKLHRPHGDFACISIAVEGRDDPYQLYDTHDLKKLFSSIKKGLWVLHNGIYDLIQLRRFVDIEPRDLWDTMVVEQSTNGGYYQRFSLRDLVRRRLGIIMDKEVRDEFSTATEMTPAMKEYAAVDAIRTLQVAESQREEYLGGKSIAAYTTIDGPMIWPLLDMQGVPIDEGAWRKEISGFETIYTSIQAELGINVNSQPQVLKACAGKGIHIQDTKATTLEQYKEFDIIAKILKARAYRKAASTYGEKWLEDNLESDGRVYSAWKINGAETGRMSSSSPNLQNIPSRKMPIYRTFFRADPGNVFIIDDVSQQEPCILAYESGDPILKKAILSGEDLHLSVAREIFGDPSMVKDDPRRNIGKTINLGTSYGLSEYGLSSKLNISTEEASRFLNKYFLRFTGVFAYINERRNFARNNGFITTAGGRKVHINLYDRSAMNNAINAPIQGGAADFTKMWTRKYWEQCRSNGIPFTLCLIVHDELGSNTPKEIVRETNKARKLAFQETAETLFPGIPFKSEVEMGRSWAAKSVKEELLDLDEEESDE